MSQKQTFHDCANQLDPLIDYLKRKYEAEKYEIQVLEISDPIIHGKYFSAKAKSDKQWVSNLKTWTGMRVEGTAKITIHGNDLEVEVIGKWLDKAAAIGVSIVVLWPLLVTGGIGAWSENKLLDQISADISNFLATCQKVASGKSPVFCPACGVEAILGTKFCGNCGQKLS